MYSIIENFNKTKTNNISKNETLSDLESLPKVKDNFSGENIETLGGFFRRRRIRRIRRYRRRRYRRRRYRRRRYRRRRYRRRRYRRRRYRRRRYRRRRYRRRRRRRFIRRRTRRRRYRRRRRTRRRRGLSIFAKIQASNRSVLARIRSSARKRALARRRAAIAAKRKRAAYNRRMRRKRTYKYRTVSYRGPRTRSVTVSKNYGKNYKFNSTTFKKKKKPIKIRRMPKQDGYKYSRDRKASQNMENQTNKLFKKDTDLSKAKVDTDYSMRTSKRKVPISIYIGAGITFFAIFILIGIGLSYKKKSKKN